MVDKLCKDELQEHPYINPYKVLAELGGEWNVGPDHVLAFLNSNFKKESE